jgi:uncharacterized membrane protein
MFEEILNFLKRYKVILFILGYLISTIFPIPLIGFIIGIIIAFISEVYNSLYLRKYNSDGMIFGYIALGSLVGYLIILLHIYI